VTDKQMRLAIAEACPELFRRCNCSHECSLLVFRGSGTKVDPLTDLNAMAAAEQVLTDDQYFDYCRKRLPSAQKSEIAQGRTATARQRAEAFLRAIGKWEGV